MPILHSFLILVVASFCSAVPLTTTLPTTCVYNGITYNGSFRPSPCKYCDCTAGRPVCAIQDCTLPPCEHYEHPMDRCCPVCTTGPSCNYLGHMIRHGETYRPNPYISCKCPVTSHGAPGPVQALCVHALR